MQLSCVYMRTLVHRRAGGGKKIAIVIAFMEDGGLAGGSCCSRLPRAGVQVLKAAAGPEIVTLATVILVAVQQRSPFPPLLCTSV